MEKIKKPKKSLSVSSTKKNTSHTKPQSKNPHKTPAKPPVKKLGRGMGALGITPLLQKKINLADASLHTTPSVASSMPIKKPHTHTTKQNNSNNNQSLIYLDIQKIEPNPNQPRTFFDEEQINALSQSIKNQGLLQPLLVTQTNKQTTDTNLIKYSIVAGERRYKACKKAGLKIIPVLVLSLNEEQVFEAAIVENLQRVNLNPIETALSFQNLIRMKNLTHDTLAKTLGISRSRITNTLRLLSLPNNIKKALEKGILSSSHARAILSFPDEKTQQVAFEKIIKENISVHDFSSFFHSSHKKSNRSKNHHSLSSSSSKKTNKNDTFIYLDEYKQRLIEFFGTHVTLTGTLKKGCIKIEFYNKEDFSRILHLLDIDK